MLRHFRQVPRILRQPLQKPLVLILRPIPPPRPLIRHPPGRLHTSWPTSAAATRRVVLLRCPPWSCGLGGVKEGTKAGGEDEEEGVGVGFGVGDVFRGDMLGKTGKVVGEEGKAGEEACVLGGGPGEVEIAAEGLDEVDAADGEECGEVGFDGGDGLGGDVCREFVVLGGPVGADHVEKSRGFDVGPGLAGGWRRRDAVVLLLDEDHGYPAQLGDLAARGFEVFHEARVSGRQTFEDLLFGDQARRGARGLLAG